MRDSIFIAASVLGKTPEILRDLPEGRYALEKIKYRDNPVHGKYLPDAFKREGELAIVDRGGMPAIRIVGYGVYDGLTTSGIIEATRDSTQNHIDILTENSHYKLEGPLSDDSGAGEDDCE